MRHGLPSASRRLRASGLASRQVAALVLCALTTERPIGGTATAKTTTNVNGNTVAAHVTS